MSDQKDIIIYESKEGYTKLEVNLQEETVWLTQEQLSLLFNKDVRTVSEHITNIYEEGELDKKPTIRKFRIVRKEGNRQVKRNIQHYNLDVIISVGYRVKSIEGTRFRKWATNILKQHLIEGYTLNQKRLKEKASKYEELKAALKLMEKAARSKELEPTEAEGLLKVISDFSYSLDMLDRFDHEQLDLPEVGSTDRWKITYKDARKAIETLRKRTQASELFGREKDKSLRGSIGAIYQSFDGKDVYPTAEIKAAHLLYFLVKNHSFSDGNKRIAAYLFLLFLQHNGLLYTEEGLKRISDSTLVALTLMVAESNPSEKEMIVKVIVHLLQAGDHNE
ncbi:RhuM family protein [Gracilimonas mengyeensis]|nr:RhuM family protein [Gracilimonas mengyeensis]